MKFKTAIVCVAALINAISSQAATTEVDVNFTSYAEGNAVSGIAGVSFSLSESLDGPSLLGTPKINTTNDFIAYRKIADITGLSNSLTGIEGNPTKQFLFATFDGLASEISFTFNNLNGSLSSTTSVTYFDSTGANYTKDLGNLSWNRNNITLTSLFGHTIADVTKLAFSNFSDSSSGTRNPNYLFSISSIHATVVSAVPEPTSAAMLGLGLMALIAVRRRNFY